MPRIGRPCPEKCWNDCFRIDPRTLTQPQRSAVMENVRKSFVCWFKEQKNQLDAANPKPLEGDSVGLAFLCYSIAVTHWFSYESSLPAREWVISEGSWSRHVQSPGKVLTCGVFVVSNWRKGILSVCSCVTDVLEWTSREACGSRRTFITQCLNGTELTGNKKGTIKPNRGTCVFF